MKRANSIAPDALRDALTKTSGLKLVTGEPKFNNQGDDVGKYLLLTIIKGNRFELLKIVTGS